MSQYGNYTPDYLEALKQKRQQIINVITENYLNTVNLVKQLPKDGKRNPFSKTYNRRPRNKQKRGAVMAQLIISAKMAETEVRIIQSTPIPRFKKGSAMVKSTACIVGSDGKEETISRESPFLL